MTATLISAEDYLMNEMMKSNRQQMEDKLSEITERYTRSSNIENSNKIEMWRTDIEIKQYIQRNMEMQFKIKIMSQYEVNKPIRGPKAHRHMKKQ